jgi:hypothetical protein
MNQPGLPQPGRFASVRGLTRCTGSTTGPSLFHPAIGTRVARRPGGRSNARPATYFGFARATSSPKERSGSCGRTRLGRRAHARQGPRIPPCRPADDEPRARPADHRPNREPSRMRGTTYTAASDPNLEQLVVPPEYHERFRTQKHAANQHFPGVGDTGLEPVTSALSRRRSPS